jgi:hypothetical protein
VTQVAALCVQQPSSFDGLADCYGEARDARSWPGGSPVIAMPPCRQWSRLRAFARDIPRERELGIWCADAVRKWGGVLEQPAASALFRAAMLPDPSQSDGRGFTISVLQFWWGHEASKPTWLYIAGLDQSNLPDVPLVLGRATKTVQDHLSKRQRDATPPRFAQWLVETARRCKAQVVRE